MFRPSLQSALTVHLLATAVVLGLLAQPASAAATGELELLVLGGTDSEVVTELMHRHRITRAPAGDPQRALEQLAGVDALVVDMHDLDDDLRPRVDAVVDLAHRTGVAVLAANASADDTKRWVGLGIDGDLIVLGLAPNGRTPTLEIIAPKDSARGAEGAFMVAARADRIEETIESNTASTGQKGAGPQRINYKAWFLGGEVLQWTPSGNPGGSNQIATLNISYQVELVANSELNEHPNARYLKITTLGTGMNPGALPSTSDQDENRERGWFQEQLHLEMEPSSTAGLALIAAAPQTTETYSTYSETTGWEAGVDSEGKFGLTLSQSQTSSTTFGNFRVAYTGPGATARWDYTMDSAGGDAQAPYNDPFDLISGDLFDCGLSTCLREVNEMSVSTIGLRAEAVWRAALDFDETVSFHMWHEQDLAFIRFTHSECQAMICSDWYEAMWDWASQGFHLAVDFSQVHPYGPDDDSDGIPNYIEDAAPNIDPDNDGVGNSQDPDADGDGLADSQEWLDDLDDDGKPNYLDTDSDGDGFPDDQEAAAGTDPYLSISRPDITMAKLALGRWSTDSNGSLVTLPPGMVDPIVLVGPATDDDPAPGSVRITDRANTHFAAGFQEWPSEDGVHGSETFSWLALEAGRFATTSNSIWEADLATVTGSGSWTRVTFSAPLPDVPIVVASLQTNTSGQALAIRLRNITTDGFDLALFTEEDAPEAATAETVGFLAVDSRWGSDRVVVDGAEVPVLVQEFSADHQPTALLSSFIRLDEETAADAETDHPPEAMAALAFGREIFVQDQAAVDLDPVTVRWDPADYAAGIEIGLIRGVTRDSSLIVPYSRSFTEPIVIAYPDDPTDSTEGVVRVRPVHRTASLQRFQIPGGFSVHFQLFPNDTPGWFDECRNFFDPPRDIRYVVAESGSGQIGGLLWEAGSVYSNLYQGEGNWESLFFQTGFTEAPSVFSDLQHERCGDILGADHTSVSATGLDISNDYLSQDCAYCTFVVDPEEDWYELGYLAIQPGEGATVDDRLIQVTGSSVEIVYGAEAPEAPTARFTWSPTNPRPGQPVQFTDTATGVVSQWSWNFGDGATSTQQHPVHTFTAPGTYLVLQAVSSNLGLDTTTIAITIGGDSDILFADDFESGNTGSWSITSN